MKEEDYIELKLLKLPRKCLVCQGELSYTDNLLICPNCGALYHVHCAAELMGKMNCLLCGKVPLNQLQKW